MGNIVKAPLSLIRENPVALRAVNRQSEEYLGLVDSIRTHGFFGAVTGRKKVDPDTKGDYYEIVDGLHRTMAARDAGLTEINVDIMEMSDAQTLEAQILANVHKIETRPVEYTKQILRMLNMNPLFTEAEIASRLHKSTTWIKERLSLVKITNPTIEKLVDDGKIKLANAYALAKLPNEEMANFTDRAMTLPADEFIPQVDQRVKEIRDARRQGKDAPEAEFQPVAHLQKISLIKDEIAKMDIVSKLIKKFGTKSADDGAKLALQWVMHMDPVSVQVQKDKDVERRAEREKAKQTREIERLDKKVAKDKEKAEIAAKAAEEAKAILLGQKPAPAKK